MGSQTLYVEVRQGNSVMGLILVSILLILTVFIVYALGLITNTYPYWEKQMLKGELECKEFHKLLKQYLNYKHMGSSNFIVKLVNRNSKMLEDLYNKGKDDDEKQYLYKHKIDGEASQFDAYVTQYNIGTIPSTYLDGSEKAPKSFFDGLQACDTPAPAPAPAP